MDAVKFSVPKPCNENWNAMTPGDKGRFCAMCEKTVVDFTGMKAPEISAYLLANQSNKVCGRFEATQLAQQPLRIEIPRSVLFSQTSFRNIFMLALFVTMGTTLLSCKGHDDNTMMLGEPAIVDSTTIDSVAMVPPWQKDDKITEARNGTAQHPDSKPDPRHAVMNTTGAVAIAPIPVHHLTGEVAPEPIIPKPETHLMGDTIVAPKD